MDDPKFANDPSQLVRPTSWDFSAETAEVAERTETAAEDDRPGEDVGTDAPEAPGATLTPVEETPEHRPDAGGAGRPGLARYEAALEAEVESQDDDARLAPVPATALLALVRAVMVDAERREARTAAQVDDLRRQVAALASRSINVTVEGVTVQAPAAVAEPARKPQPEPIALAADPAPVAGLGDAGAEAKEGPSAAPADKECKAVAGKGKDAGGKALARPRMRLTTKVLAAALVVIIICCVAFVALQVSGIGR